MALSENGLSLLRDHLGEDRRYLQDILDTLNGEDRSVETEDVEIACEQLETLCAGMESLAEIYRDDQGQSLDETLRETINRAWETGKVLIEDQEDTVALESVDGVVTMESIVSQAKRLWELMVQAVQRLWNIIKGFFDGVSGDISRIKLRCKQVRHRAQNASGRSVKQMDTELGREINGLITFHRYPRNGKDIIDGLREYDRQLTVMLGSYTTHLKKMGDNLKLRLSSVDMNAADKALEGINATVGDFDLLSEASKAGTLYEVHDARWGGSDVKRLPYLMGRKSVFFIYPRKRNDSGTTLAVAESLRNRRALIALSSAETYEAHVEGMIKTIPAGNVIDICDEVIQICDRVLEYQPNMKMLETLQEDMRKATKGLSSAIENNSSIDSPTFARVRAMINYNTSFARWATQPQVALCSNALTSCRSGLIASGKSMQNYG